MFDRTTAHQYKTRCERFYKKENNDLDVDLTIDSGGDAKTIAGRLADLSVTGMRLLAQSDLPDPGTYVSAITIRMGNDRTVCAEGAAEIARTELDTGVLALKFRQREQGLLAAARPWLVPAPYVTGEIRDDFVARPSQTFDATSRNVSEFYAEQSPDLFKKCSSFTEYIDDLISKQYYQPLYRLTVLGALDHKIAVFDPISRVEREMVCFDSNSYLGLHLDRRVIEATKRAVESVGYGTPSAQMLSGANGYLRELEVAIAEFHGRGDAIIFPCGNAANIGVITALVRQTDMVARDQFCHASLHDACRAVKARAQATYTHGQLADLENTLMAFDAGDKSGGKLIVTDGVFSMNGRIADLPGLVRLAQKYKARLLVDDMHGTGIIGPNGRGIEDYYGVPGSIDIIVGGLSKTIGAIGGYVTGSRELVTYLRVFANTGMFTTALPAAICAGAIEAFKILVNEPEHRALLWKNVHRFADSLRAAGLVVNDGEEVRGPIIPIFLGAQRFAFHVCREIFEAGIKCGSVFYPAVPKKGSILRFTLSSRHTEEELDRAVEVLAGIYKKYGLLHRTAQEISEISEKLGS